MFSNNFWADLKIQHPSGIVGLSPMDGVTDLPMRLITARYGHPDILWTEFVNVEGMLKNPQRLERALWTDISSEKSTPTIAQLYGLRPENFAALTRRLVNHDIPHTSDIAGIDLNMGCPARQVALNGAGAGLIQNPSLAKEIYLATLEAAQGKLPVSIKTRLGFNQLEIENWLGFLAEELKPAALTIHGRTYRQGYTLSADWQSIAAVATLTKQLSPATIVLGNGDVRSRVEGEQKVRGFGVDGVLIGRAALGNPFVFRSEEEKSSKNKCLAIAREHALLYEQIFSSLDHYSFMPMRKHLAWYAHGFASASQLRARLIQSNSAADVPIH